GTLRQAGRGSQTLPLHRHHGQESAAAEDRGADTDLAQGRRARPQMATQSARRPPRGDGEQTSPSWGEVAADVASLAVACCPRRCWKRIRGSSYCSTVVVG